MATGEQNTLAITYKGGPFTVIRHAIPTPGPGELLVKVQGTGLNPAEWKLQTGIFDPAMLIDVRLDFKLDPSVCLSVSGRDTRRFLARKARESSSMPARPQSLATGIACKAQTSSVALSDPVLV